MTTFIKTGWGFDAGQNFARAAKDTPIRLAPDEHAKPGCVIGYIAGDPKHTLGFMRYPEVRVQVQKAALRED